jgi:hypothetical protein
MMVRFDPRFIDGLSREASGLLKAIRCIQALEANLPAGFPEPTTIKPSRKPYDLILEWNAEHPKHVEALRNRITAGLGIDSKWNHSMPPTEVAYDMDHSIICRGRVRLDGKASLNLFLRINSKAGAEPARSSGRRD